MSARRVAALAAAVAALLVPAACGGDSEPAASDAGTSPTATINAQPTSTTTFPLTVRNCGEDVTLEKRPDSVLAGSPIAIDFMIAAGAVDKITHRAGGHGRPLDGDRTMVSDRPVLSHQYETPREVILGSGVDTIVASYLYGVTRAGLAKDGIPFLVPEQTCDDTSVGKREPYESLRPVDSTYRTLEMLAKIFGTEIVVAAKIADIKGRIAAVDSAFDPGPFKTALYFLIGEYKNGDVTGFGKPTMPQEFLDVLGLQNVVTENVRYDTISPERLIDLDPDVMIIGSVGSQAKTSIEERITFVKAIPGASDMKAVKTNSFVFLDAGSGFNPSPSQADALEDVARQITALAAR